MHYHLTGRHTVETDDPSEYKRIRVVSEAVDSRDTVIKMLERAIQHYACKEFAVHGRLISELPYAVVTRFRGGFSMYVSHTITMSAQRCSYGADCEPDTTRAWLETLDGEYD